MSAILECHGLTKKYGGVYALAGAELTLETGRIVGLLGPNGSGKTTLIKLANGLLTPTAGTLTIDGEAPGKGTHAKVAYLPDADYLPDNSVPASLRNALLYLSQASFTGSQGDCDHYAVTTPYGESAMSASDGYPTEITDPHSGICFKFTAPSEARD